MIRSMIRLFGMGLLVGLTAMNGFAADKPAGTDDPSGSVVSPEALQTIVSQSADKFAKVFAERDATALAKLFTPEAEYIDSSGTVFHGRAAIEAEYAVSFAVNPKGVLDFELLSIRPIAAGVVVEDGLSIFSPEEEGAPSRMRYTATHVRQADGSWLVASVRELEAPQQTSHDHLRELEWLVGSWHEDVDGSAISSEWKWSDDGQYLISEFTARATAEIQWKGSHRVGWDAERQQFRSWVFDSSGGTAEGWWRAGENGGWTVMLTGVDAEGVRVSSLLGYTPDGEDAIFVEQQLRTRGGVSLPGTAHRIVRRPPAPGALAAER